MRSPQVNAGQPLLQLTTRPSNGLLLCVHTPKSNSDPSPSIRTNDLQFMQSPLFGSETDIPQRNAIASARSNNAASSALVPTALPSPAYTTPISQEIHVSLPKRICHGGSPETITIDLRHCPFVKLMMISGTDPTIEMRSINVPWRPPMSFSILGRLLELRTKLLFLLRLSSPNRKRCKPLLCCDAVYLSTEPGDPIREISLNRNPSTAMRRACLTTDELKNQTLQLITPISPLHLMISLSTNQAISRL